MTHNEIEAYDAIIVDRDRWKERAERLESLCPADGTTCSQGVPAHYAVNVTPWDLQRCMKSSGNAFVDARRADAMEYSFRIKEDLLGDLIKGRHCLDEAIKVLSANDLVLAPAGEKTQPTK